MRESGICTHCGGQEVVKITSSVWKRGYNYIYVGVFTYLYPTKYICTYCGFIESYVENDKHLKILKKKFPFIKDDSDFMV